MDIFRTYAAQYPVVLRGASWSSAHALRVERYETRDITWGNLSEFCFFQTEADAVEAKLLCPDLHPSSIDMARGWVVAFDARGYLTDRALYEDDGMCGVKHEAIHAVYTFGSQVYGTVTWKSDHDVILIADGVNDGEEKRIKEFNIHFYTPATFRQKIMDHDVVALECYFNPRSTLLDVDFQLDLQKLRRSFSAKASNSWVKCKKKLEVERDYYIGKKSLWHSLRILMMGIDIATNGRITKYDCANHIYTEIVLSGETNWTYFKEKYQPLFNQLNTEFRKVAPL